MPEVIIELADQSPSREIDHAFDDAFAFAGERCDRIIANVLAALNRSAS